MSKPTPDKAIRAKSHAVDELIASVRGAFATTGGPNPVFEHNINVEEVVRFILFRVHYYGLPGLQNEEEQG